MWSRMTRRVWGLLGDLFLALARMALLHTGRTAEQVGERQAEVILQAAAGDEGRQVYLQSLGPLRLRLVRPWERPAPTHRRRRYLATRRMATAVGALVLLAAFGVAVHPGEDYHPPAAGHSNDSGPSLPFLIPPARADAEEPTNLPSESPHEPAAAPPPTTRSRGAVPSGHDEAPEAPPGPAPGPVHDQRAPRAPPEEPQPEEPPPPEAPAPGTIQVTETACHVVGEVTGGELCQLKVVQLLTG